MRVIGITGRSGSGKSAVTAYMAAQGCPTVDGDAVSRRLLRPGAAEYPALLAQLQKAFGYDIVDGAGVLRRRLLADRAFASPQGTRTLDAITHPAILRAVQAEIGRAEKTGADLFFLDGAAIVGTAFARLCDVLVLVTAPEAASVRRICARDGISEAAARRRLAAQTPENVLRAAADHVLVNDGDLARLQQKAAALLAALREGTASPGENT